MSLNKSVDEADFLSGTGRRVTGGTGGRGGLPEACPLPVCVVVVPPGPTVTEVAGLAYKLRLS